MGKIKIMVVDDHQIIRDGINAILMSNNDIEIIAEAGNSEELFEKLKHVTPNIIILDISMPMLSGIEITKILTKEYPKIKVIIFSSYTNDDSIFDALKAGAKGYITKETVREELVNAIYTVNTGENFLSESISNTVLVNFIHKDKYSDKYSAKDKSNLTNREIEILKLIAEGLSYKEIGEKLFISSRTVETHKNHILQKLELRTIVDLVKYAIKNNYIEL